MSNLTDLPFDQFSRQKIAQLVIDNVLKDKDTINIIDLGGHKGHTKDFNPLDNVTILDVFDEDYEGYVKGDATSTTFSDNEFDVVVSFDTLEHIPRDKREEFFKEALRISKRGVIIAAPFDNDSGDILAAEIEVNNTYKKINGEDHQWLFEHIELGTPKKNEIEAFIDSANVEFVAIPTNDLNIWQMIQGVMFNSTVFSSDIEEAVDISRFYNKNMLNLEFKSEITYRTIYVISKDKNIISDVDKFISKLSKGASLNKSKKIEIELIEKINIAYSTMLNRQKNDIEYLSAREKHLQEEYNKLAIKYNDVQKLANNNQVN